MQIGHYKLYEIATSRFGLDGGAMFGIIPKPLWEKYSPADENNRIEMSTRSLLLVSDEHKILIDTGNGDKWQEKFKAIYDIDTKTVNLELSLKQHGFTVDDITDVYNTHLHFDHIAGGTRLINGKVEPTVIISDFSGEIGAKNVELLSFCMTPVPPQGEDDGYVPIGNANPVQFINKNRQNRRSGKRPGNVGDDDGDLFSGFENIIQGW